MRIAIFGTGAVGGYFGGRLAAAGEDVTFIARGAHLAALQEQGLRITSPKGNIAIPVKATNDSASIGPVDVVLLTVKLYDVDAAIPSLAPLIGPDTVVITLQNGVEAVDMVGKHVGADHVAGGVAYIVAVVDEPGHIRHTVADRLVFGETRRSAVATAAGVPGGGPPRGIRRRPDDRHRHRAVGEVRAAGDVERHDLGDALARWATIREHPELLAMMDAALDEAMAVGRARGITFPDGLVEGTQEMVRNFPPGSKSSMLEDLERGRRLELPWLSGAIARMGRESGVPTPTHGFINAILLPFVNGRG